MARNKYPEETVQKILEVSYRLFLEKGYDHTTIQDITDALGMSKGAVYHHFKSKEDILDRISTSYYDEVNWFRDVREMKGLTGLEKLRKILEIQLSDQNKLEMDSITVSLYRNPRLTVLLLESTIHDASPFCQQLIEEGIQDGSIQSTEPKELAEVFMLLLNVWIGMFAEGAEDCQSKLRFTRTLTERMGLPVIDDALMDTANGYFARVMHRQAAGPTQ